MAKKLPKGIRKSKSGGYEARAMVKGKRIYIYSRDLDSLVVDFEKAKEEAANEVEYLKRNLTLDNWFHEWFENVKCHKVKETSRPTMRNGYKRTFGFYMGRMKITDIRPIDIQNTINAMEKAGASHSAMRDNLGRIRECLEFAVANQFIPANPCIQIEVPWSFRRPKEEVALSQEEQNEFLSAMEDNWYRELAYFMCLTGVRVGELGGVKWKDIDVKNKTIRIERALSCNYVDGVKRQALTTPKTVNSIRTIPFIGEMEEILLSQKQKQSVLKKELGKRWRGKGEFEDLVFTTGMGSPCNRYIVDKEIKKALNRMRTKEAQSAMEENREPREFRDFHPHSLRHTFATRCFEAGMEPKVVQMLMGHSSITVTLNIYTHVMKSKLHEEVSKFGLANKEPIVITPIETPSFSAHAYY